MELLASSVLNRVRICLSTFKRIWTESTLCNNNNNLLHLYSAFLGTQSALHRRGGGGGDLLNHHQCACGLDDAPGWCDGSNIAPECPPHTSLLAERRQSDEANQCMGMIRRPWWSEANGEIWPNLGFLMTTESQDLGLTSHPKDGAFWQ